MTQLDMQMRACEGFLTLSNSDPLVIFYRKDLKWNCDHDPYCLLFYKFFDSLGHLEGIQTKSKSLVTPTFFELVYSNFSTYSHLSCT